MIPHIGRMAPPAMMVCCVPAVVTSLACAAGASLLEQLNLKTPRIDDAPTTPTLLKAPRKPPLP